MRTWPEPNRDRSNPPTLADSRIGRIEPQVAPLAGQRAIEEFMHALVYFFAKLGHRAFGCAAQAHRLSQVGDLARRNPPILAS